VSVKARYDAAHPTCNVVGVLRGGDPGLAGQALVIGGHLDHVGRQGPDLYFPGANDNASGSSAVLRLAEAFARAGQRPARTVVFVLFAGEESGLEGAKYHAAQPLLPLADTVAMFNLDCVACGDSIQVGSGKTSPELWARAQQLDAAHDACLVTRTWGDGGADATPFHDGGVRTLYWVTTNSYPHLHLPGDQPETLNGPLYEKLVRLCFRTAWDVAMGGGS
jgi:aminopeptidase YwaD